MRSVVLLRVFVMGAALALPSHHAFGTTPAPIGADATAKAKKVNPVKPVATKSATTKSTTKTVVNKAAPLAKPVAVVAGLSAGQLAVADKVMVGDIPCELAVHVKISPDTHSAGRFNLEVAHKRYLMEPVMSQTGAVRLENAASGMVWLQLGTKSMLMNQKEGRRVADDCMSPEQAHATRESLKSPPVNLLEGSKSASTQAAGAVSPIVVEKVQVTTN